MSSLSRSRSPALSVTLALSLTQVRASRDTAEAKRCLSAIEECARTREGNLLGLAVDAARARYPLTPYP